MFFNKHEEVLAQTAPHVHLAQESSLFVNLHIKLCFYLISHQANNVQTFRFVLIFKTKNLHSVSIIYSK